MQSIVNGLFFFFFLFTFLLLFLFYFFLFYYNNNFFSEILFIRFFVCLWFFLFSFSSLLSIFIRRATISLSLLFWFFIRLFSADTYLTIFFFSGKPTPHIPFLLFLPRSSRPTHTPTRSIYYLMFFKSLTLPTIWFRYFRGNRNSSPCSMNNTSKNQHPFIV